MPFPNTLSSGTNTAPKRPVPDSLSSDSDSGQGKRKNERDQGMGQGKGKNVKGKQKKGQGKGNNEKGQAKGKKQTNQGKAGWRKRQREEAAERQLTTLYLQTFGNLVLAFDNLVTSGERQDFHSFFSQH